MIRTVNINGEPYTSAAEDLDLMKIKSAMQKSLHEEIQRALLCHREGEFAVNMAMAFSYFEIAYALGRAREECTRPPTETHRRRLESIIQDATDRLGKQIWDSTMNAKEGRGELILEPVTELLDQAYYAGREDGAA